jgi:hypothetical protein
VRPLEGGFDAWRERNYPLELLGLVNLEKQPEQVALPHKVVDLE